MKAKPAVGTGVLVLGAALLGPAANRVSPSVAAGTSVDPVVLQVAQASTPKAKVPTGPWQASCNYWGFAREPHSPAKENSESTDVSDTGSADGSADDANKVQCGPRQWGAIPQVAEAAGRRITALTATVPDPVHTSMSMEFDRMVDVIMQAAEDNGYVMSYYWLPWQRVADKKASKAKKSEPGGEEEHNEEQEREPGLLIFKPAAPHCDLPGETTTDLSSCKEHVLYMFLVGQAPGFGTNRTQLRKALRYEADLWASKQANLSLRDAAHEADIIGPNSSGAASSLRAELEAARFDPAITQISIAGSTSTRVAAEALQGKRTAKLPALRFTSFSEDSVYEMSQLESLFNIPSVDSPLAWLTETGTTFGSATGSVKDGKSKAIRIHFPREISILRNAQKEETGAADAAGAAVADADPYLHLSLKNGDAEDTIPHFSREIFPYVEESEWMAVVRELQGRHTDVVAISASNVLDALFLAKSIYRDLPDVRPVFFASNDLLYVRSGDAEPYVGSIAVTAYPLTNLAPGNDPGRLNNYASFWTEAFYNAVSYTLWNPRRNATPRLAGYTVTENGGERPPPLWATTIGRDGYYPLSLLSPCSSGEARILPKIEPLGRETGATLCDTRETEAEAVVVAAHKGLHEHPSIAWFVLSTLVLMLCLAYIIVLKNADFWSPSTHDLDIAHSDEPRRRAVYLHICSAMMFAMSAVISIPAFCIAHKFGVPPLCLYVATLTLLCGLGTIVATLLTTLPHIRRPLAADMVPRSHCGQPALSQDTSVLNQRAPDAKNWVEAKWRAVRSVINAQQAKWAKLRFFFAEIKLYPFFHVVALLAALLIPVLWYLLCTDRWPFASGHKLLGTFFSYRCLYPASGVSPLLPVLLILLSWSLWAYFQTCRLRFSENSRPILPGPLGPPDIYSSLYVSDAMLSDCSGVSSSCLYDNVSCLLITHRILWRATAGTLHFFNFVFLGGYFLVFVGFVLFMPIRGLDHYLRHPLIYHLTPYEFLITAMFYPLLVIALTGALRMILIWTSLRSGLLERLERSPLRFAFSRLTNISWMTMLRQSGMVEYWRDMTRSNESMAQILNSRALLDFVAGGKACLAEAVEARARLESHIRLLYDMIRDQKTTDWNKPGNFLVGPDLPLEANRGFLNLLCAIECEYARFSEVVLGCVLLPYWKTRRAELVDAEAPGDEAPSRSVTAAPAPIQLAEEFLAMRYLSLTRAILINLRQLMTYVSVSFVLALLAWNSYPFQPRRWVDWGFTGLLFGLGAAIVWVFAQMHRNPILSRITGTEANKLGIDFFIRMTLFGAAPVLTWLASQFPAVGSTIFRVFQQGMSMAK